jgi:hypothetical protein
MMFPLFDTSRKNIKGIEISKIDGRSIKNAGICDSIPTTAVMIKTMNKNPKISNIYSSPVNVLKILAKSFI